MDAVAEEVRSHLQNALNLKSIFKKKAPNHRYKPYSNKKRVMQNMTLLIF